MSFQIRPLLLGKESNSTTSSISQINKSQIATGSYYLKFVMVEGTFSKYASLDDQIDPWHFYFMLLKFGTGRATNDAAHEVRENLITRDEAVRLVRRYDAEYPSEKSYKFILEYCDFTEEEFRSTCERWRNLNLWEKKGSDWVLKQQVT